MTNITFSQVQKSFHKKLVLDIPDFQADSGEIFSIVGGNGAGKSTFIKLLAGIFLQDKGESLQENPLAGQVCLGERAGVVQLFDSYGESPIFSKLEWDCLVSYQGRGGYLV